MSRAEPTVTQTVYSQSEHYEFGYMYPDSSALLSLFTVKTSLFRLKSDPYICTGSMSFN